jgi:putative ABC transport system permease protein
MAIPLIYNLRSLRARWTSSVVAVLGIAGTVGVFVAMLSLARGFEATLVASGFARNAMVLRAGATSEMLSVVDLGQVHVIEDAPGVARGSVGALVSPEVVVVAAFPLRKTGTDTNVQVRGVSPKALAVREVVKIVAGRLFQPGLAELVVGRNVARSYVGFELGKTVRFGGGTWTVVGVFDAGGSAFDSELWCDANVLNQTFQRPQNIFQSVTVRLTSPDALGRFKDALTSDPRVTVQVEREIDYYAKQSRALTTLIRVLGTIVALVMGIGAVFGALNTMYSAVAERSREIATIRALGFSSGSVVLSFVVEALCIACVGGVLGCAAVVPLNGLTTGTINWQTFSHLAFAFRVTPLLLAVGLVFALLMGLVGGVPPAIRAARQRIAVALREL